MRNESAQEQDRLREERDAARAEATARETRDRRAQAMQVVGWVDRVEVVQLELNRYQVTVGDKGAALALHGFLANYSSAGVFDVTYKVHDRGTGDVLAERHLRHLPPNTEPIRVDVAEPDHEADVVASVRFRDAQGRRWRWQRIQEGHLDEGRLERLDDRWQPIPDLAD